MHVCEDEIRLPDLQHVDEIDDHHLNPSLSLHSNGTVYGIFSGRLDFRCDLNFFYYPFDQQHCFTSLFDFYFTSLFDPGYDESEINFTLTHHEIDMATFIKHGLWDITHADAE